MTTGTLMRSPVVELAIVTAPEYVPGASPAGFAVACRTVELATLDVPLPGPIVSQFPPETVAAAAVKLSDPPP
jgi:hypothetical protein